MVGNGCFINDEIRDTFTLKWLTDQRGLQTSEVSKVSRLRERSTGSDHTKVKII